MSSGAEVVAGNLRRLRAEKGLTLGVLADLSGWPKAP
jgi:hypothetical protein